MNFNYFKLAITATLFMVSCSNDAIEIPEKPETEVTPEQKPNEKPEEKPQDTGNPVSISVGIKGMEESRSGIIERFVQGNNLSILKKEIPYTFSFDGVNWVNTQNLKIDSTTVLTAIHPVISEITDGFTLIDINKQDDVMFDQQTVTSDFPTAKFNLKHKLTLVRIKILKDEYIGNGVVSDFKIGNTYTSCRLHVQNGEITTGMLPKGDINFGNKYVLNDQNPETVDVIVAGKNEGDNVSFSFLLDGEVKNYQFPDWHRWEEGLMYTYTLKIKGKYNSAINKDDVPVDVEYWSQFGKTDEIIIKEPASDDWERYFTYSPRHKESGYYLYQNEGFALGFNYSHWGNHKFFGKVRGVITKNGEIVEKFPTYTHLPDAKINFSETAAYVVSQPGVYKFEVLFQKDGETTWMRGHEEGNPEEYLFEILPTPSEDDPALRQLYLENDENYHPDRVYPIPDDDSFNLIYVISNKGKHNLNGEIKVVWERDFSVKGMFQYPSQKKEGKPNDNEWHDEIGRMKISIPSGVKFWKGIVSCKIPVSYPAPTYYNGAQIYLYWREAGKTEWTILRLDGDYLFNRNYNDGYIFKEANNNISVRQRNW